MSYKSCTPSHPQSHSAHPHILSHTLHTLTSSVTLCTPSHSQSHSAHPHILSHTLHTLTSSVTPCTPSHPQSHSAPPHILSHTLTSSVTPSHPQSHPHTPSRLSPLPMHRCCDCYLEGERVFFLLEGAQAVPTVEGPCCLLEGLLCHS